MVQPGFDLGRRPDRHRNANGSGVDARLLRLRTQGLNTAIRNYGDAL
jgi:hypothetical protein